MTQRIGYFRCTWLKLRKSQIVAFRHGLGNLVEGHDQRLTHAAKISGAVSPQRGIRSLGACTLIVCLRTLVELTMSASQSWQRVIAVKLHSS